MSVMAQEYSAPVSTRFPTGFLFGAATAAYQIEGAAFEDGRTASIWDAFSRVPGAVIGGDNGDIACDHYHRYRDDVALMKELGLDTYRFSTSWSRVRPDGGAVNEKGLDFYKRLVDELLGADILPWLTLYHWDLPQALEDRGGWTVRETSERFLDYAMSVHDALGDRVVNWTTLNEPWCSSFLSYTGGIHAPGRFSIADGMRASHHLLLGHGLVVDELRRRDADLRLGITLNLTVAEPADAAKPEDVDAARRIDGQFNRWFLDPIFGRGYPADIVADIRAVDAAAVERFEEAVLPGDLETISRPLDALGVNYYHGEFVGGTPPEDPPLPGDAPTDRVIGSPWPAGDAIYWYERGLPRTSMHWEVQPEALTVLLQRVWAEYAKDAGTALYVTENGAAFDDEAVTEGDGLRVHDADRVAFLRGHLAAIADAAEGGVDVRGYFYWSLMDNFEWAWGYEKRFGLIRVDYATQRRTLKDSALEYRRVIAARAIE
ncbi:beta-glucosidase [Microbacterium sp. EYE_5]|uniref:GH1 family beta-glucosidase n=1 Tax=unclassified Microbacterium TaxID=2609290 RepID=UPI0020055D9F|nr:MULTISPECIES: GH1 family beta-glucosidase [unclassified Microbacterium]MCK6079681.1 beta-glucosidase [Microbacterium sp. EYE_382]MCK6084952.1 beta-glucosidase [Microbacterium sp. EYE_384]MCK6122822.1 beta-glucosidase [Microbacterium sp. EYE_80]MCK6125715.1 beta-glucosidase [Microbacterium sp. EYE_79]MCK6140636.1 beta-glucosidase [Microbacterium sp. EYE_39]